MKSTGPGGDQWAPFVFRKGMSVSHPQLKSLRLKWGKHTNPKLGPVTIAFLGKVDGVLALLNGAGHHSSRVALPYETWFRGKDLFQRGEFQFLLRRPGDFIDQADPIVIIQWSHVGQPTNTAAPRVPSSNVPESSGLPPSASAQFPPRPPGRVSCDNCRFLRSPRTLATEVYSHVRDFAGTELLRAMSSMLEEEQRMAVVFEQKYQDVMRDLQSSQPIEWPRMPVSRGYCGKQELAGKYYIAEAKNLDGDCPDMRPKDVGFGKRSCQSCNHYTGGFVNLIGPLKQCIGSIGPEAMAMLDTVNRNLEFQAQYEMAEGHGTVGYTQKRPVLLGYCRVFSSDTRYALGPIINLAADCQEWHASGDLSGLPDELRQAMHSWSEVQRLERQQQAAEARIDPQKITNIWDISTSALAAVLDSKPYDDARIKFIADAMIALDFSKGEVQSITVQLARIFHEQRRMPYTPPPPPNLR